MPARRSRWGAGPAERGPGARAAVGRSPGSRPASVRRSATTTGTSGRRVKRAKAPQPRRLTGRAAVVGMVLLGLVLAYAYPVRIYLGQQAEIAALEQQQEDQRRRIAGLTAERRKWDDDEFVKARARKELHYVLPGETPFVVLPDPAAGDPAAGNDAGRPPTPWYDKLWSSVEDADDPDRQ